MHRVATRRALFLVLIATTVALGPGCLRRKFDLCLEDPPHPECPRDAGLDANADAPSAPDSAVDAPTEGALDAFVAPDAP
jgi:hypothetical protein